MRRDGGLMVSCGIILHQQGAKMIKKECSISVCDIDFVAVVCEGCKSELRVTPKRSINNRCAVCSKELPSQLTNELLSLLRDIKEAQNCDIRFIKSEE